MPVPAVIAPIAWKAAQIGAVAAVTWYAARRQRPEGPREIWRERVMDDVADGLETDFSRDAGEARAAAAGRLRRTVRLRPEGPGVEFDFAGLTRLRLRRV